MRVLLAAAAALAITGCGDDDEGGPPPQGEFDLAWSCIDNCADPAYPFAESTHLSINGETLGWLHGNGGPGVYETTATITGSCLHMEASNAGQRDPFDICWGDCEEGPCVTGTVTWNHPTPRTWTFVGI